MDGHAVPFARARVLFASVRLRAHLASKTSCHEKYQAFFTSCVQDDEELRRRDVTQAKEKRQYGQRPTHADRPAVRLFGPLLPEVLGEEVDNSLVEAGSDA